MTAAVQTSGGQPVKMTAAQEESLRDICRRYQVEFESKDYYLYSPDSVMMPGYAEGWVGGFNHSDRGPDRTTIYVGVDTDGRINS